MLTRKEIEEMAKKFLEAAKVMFPDREKLLEFMRNMVSVYRRAIVLFVQEDKK